MNYNPNNPAAGLQQLLGQVGGNPADLFGSRLKLPDATTVDPSQSNKKSINAGLESIDGANSLAGKTNEGTQASLLAMLKQVSPDALKAFQSEGSQLAEQMKNPGQLPQAVRDEILRNSAESGASAGIGGVGSQIGANLTARSLGLGAMDWYQSVLNNTNNYMAAAQKLIGPQKTAADFQLTASQTAQIDMSNAAAVNQRKADQAKAEAAPTPAGQTAASIWAALTGAGAAAQQTLILGKQNQPTTPNTTVGQDFNWVKYSHDLMFPNG